MPNGPGFPPQWSARAAAGAEIGARDRAQAVGYAYRHGLVHR